MVLEHGPNSFEIPFRFRSDHVIGCLVSSLWDQSDQQTGSSSHRHRIEAIRTETKLSNSFALAPVVVKKSNAAKPKVAASYKVSIVKSNPDVFLRAAVRKLACPPIRVSVNNPVCPVENGWVANSSSSRSP